jgi:uncharacterized protein (TIGR03089 family)
MERISGSPGETIESLRAVATAANATQPVLTWYDDATGERVELSGVTLDNWVAKTANLLVDGCGLTPGRPGPAASGLRSEATREDDVEKARGRASGASASSGREDVAEKGPGPRERSERIIRAAVSLPPHWQTAGVLLGCWAAGLSVSVPATAGADVIFASSALDYVAGDRFILGLAPMGLPLRAVPAGWLDYIAEVRGYGDRFAPPTPVRPPDPATPSLTHRELVAVARERAGSLGIAGGRVLVDAATYPDPVDWLLAPLSVGASIVLCGQLDPGALQKRITAERVDTVLA